MKKLPFNKLLVATGNRHKYAEIKEILKPFNIETVPAFNYKIKEPEEIGKTFEENALLKAKYYSEALEMPAIADDSGLCVNALGGEPGIYSGRFAEKCGGHEKAIKEIQKRLANKKTNDYTSCFICNISIFGLDKIFPRKYYSFEGKVEGILRFPPSGCNGFGYDPIFVPKRNILSFGEMSPEDKKRISHRAVALAKFINWLKDFS